jgi:hypothetical protein
MLNRWIKNPNAKTGPPVKTAENWAEPLLASQGFSDRFLTATVSGQNYFRKRRWRRKNEKFGVIDLAKEGYYRQSFSR